MGLKSMITNLLKSRKAEKAKNKNEIKKQVNTAYGEHLKKEYGKAQETITEGVKSIKVEAEAAANTITASITDSAETSVTRANEEVPSTYTVEVDTDSDKIQISNSPISPIRENSIPEKEADPIEEVDGSAMLRNNYIDEIADEAYKKVKSAMSRNYRSTRIKLNMDLLRDSFEGIRGVIFAKNPNVRAVTFKNIKDETYAILHIAFDKENQCYTTRDKMKKS